MRNTEELMMYDSQYKKLQELFSESIRKAQNYWLTRIDGLGYIVVTGSYDPDAESSMEAANGITIDAVLRTPYEMAAELLENWRWQWYYAHRDIVHMDDWDSIREMDSCILSEVGSEYAEELEELRRKAGEILGMDLSGL